MPESLRTKVHAAAFAGCEAITAGMFLDNLFLEWQYLTDRVGLKKLAKSSHYNWLDSWLANHGKQALSVGREEFVSMAVSFTATFATHATALLSMSDDDPQVIQAARLATDHAATIGGAYFYLSYLEAAIEFARQRLPAFVPDDEIDDAMMFRSSAAIARKHAEAYEARFTDENLDVIAVEYLHCAEPFYLNEPLPPSGLLGDSPHRTAVIKEAQRATGEIPAWVDSHSQPLIGSKPRGAKASRIVELLQQGDSPEQVALRLGTTPNYVNRIRNERYPGLFRDS